MKTCPILKAGTMLNRIQTQTNKTTVSSIYSKDAKCMGEECEWFEHGCPAHPVTKEVRDKIRAMK